MINHTKNQLRLLLPKDAFVRGVSVLTGGTASAQILLVLAAPLLTRLYSPEDFGLLAVYASLLTLIGVVSSLRYELAVPLPEDDGEAANAAVLCLILVMISTLLTGVLVLLMGSAIAAALGVPALAGYLWLLPVGVLCIGFYRVFNYWAVRTKRFSAIAGTKLCQAVATIAIQIAAFKLGGIALLFGQVAGQGVGTTTLGLTALKAAGFRRVSWLGIKKAAARYRRFPIFSTWAGLANTAGLQLPPILFMVFFGPVVVGLYALAHRVLTLPMVLVGGAIGQVFFAHAAKSYREDKLAQLVIEIHTKLSHIGLPAALMLFFIAPDFFSIVFGDEWRQAGELARWMSPWLYFQFVSSPLSAAVFSATESQQYMLIFQCVMLFLRGIAIGFGAYIGDFVTTVIFFSAASSLSYVFLLLMVSWASGLMTRQIIAPTLFSFLLALVLSAPIVIAFLIPDLSCLYDYASYLIALGLLLWRYWRFFHEWRLKDEAIPDSRL